MILNIVSILWGLQPLLDYSGEGYLLPLGRRFELCIPRVRSSFCTLKRRFEHRRCIIVCLCFLGRFLHRSTKYLSLSINIIPLVISLLWTPTYLWQENKEKKNEEKCRVFQKVSLVNNSNKTERDFFYDTKRQRNKTI